MRLDREEGEQNAGEYLDKHPAPGNSSSSSSSKAKQREKEEKERAERERTERERVEKERAERERAEKERAEKERVERDRAERDREREERAREREKERDLERDSHTRGNRRRGSNEGEPANELLRRAKEDKRKRRDEVGGARDARGDLGSLPNLRKASGGVKGKRFTAFPLLSGDGDGALGALGGVGDVFPPPSRGGGGTRRKHNSFYPSVPLPQGYGSKNRSTKSRGGGLPTWQQGGKYKNSKQSQNSNKLHVISGSSWAQNPPGQQDHPSNHSNHGKKMSYHRNNDLNSPALAVSTMSSQPMVYPSRRKEMPPSKYVKKNKKLQGRSSWNPSNLNF